MSGSRSLARRLLVAAALFIAVALAAATVLIGYVLHRFVQGQIDQRLDTQLAFLASTLQQRPNGELYLQGNADGPPFERPRAGWYWQISGSKTTLKSASLEGGELSDVAISDRLQRPPPPPKEKGKPAKGKALPADGDGPDGARLHYRILKHRLGEQEVVIIASAPRNAAMRPLTEALITLAISLAILGLALFLAMFLQIRLGLKPLTRLRSAIVDIRNGIATRLPGEQPREVAPLVGEINALLDENAANLERARRHVGNLAHGLKTPLATLAIALRDPNRDAAPLASLVDIIDRRIRHHLGRARAAALQGLARQRTPVAGRLQDLIGAISKIHSDRHLRSNLIAGADVVALCDTQDFDEMVGNIVENAFKWATSQVRVEAAFGEGIVSIRVDDDGPGLGEDSMACVLKRGQRLDETVPGHGLGLPISLELAELYGGSLRLERSSLGGLKATLNLPGSVDRKGRMN